MYSKKTNSKGKVMHFKDGKLISAKSIPEDAAVIDKDFDLPEPPTKMQMEVVAQGLNSDVFLEGHAPAIAKTLSKTVDAPVQQTANVSVEPTAERVCLVCGAPGECTRFVNLKVVDLCEDHYRTLTLGEVAAAMREKEIA